MKKMIMVAVLLGVFSVGSTVASANTGAGAAFDAHYVNNSSCTSCHTGTPGTLLQLGLDWKAQGGSSQAGPTTQAGWDALDAKYSTTYGGVDPNWTFTAPTTQQDLAATTGCISTELGLMPLMGLLLFGVSMLVRRKTQTIG